MATAYIINHCSAHKCIFLTNKGNESTLQWNKTYSQEAFYNKDKNRSNINRGSGGLVVREQDLCFLERPQVSWFESHSLPLWVSEQDP
ncbi:hypothetical protein CHARACLAT_016235 [Characodon lateralis]|uniref:Uncharacterized protein n=1 Tax=Characodon lateralis TaxID=208331 RepID=A0ABU7E0Y9_9TELE|nr:hypothetical protein [Characodon lateralis]